MIEAIETELVAVLAAALPDLAVQPFPDNPDNYRLTHPSGAVLVGYGGGRFGGPSVLAGAAQTQHLEYQLVVKTRSLRTHAGAYAVLSAIRLAVSNQDIKGARFYPTRERFEDVSNGVWTYTAVYAADVPWVSQAMMDNLGQIPPQFEEINRQAIELGNVLPGTTADFVDSARALIENGTALETVVGGGLKAASYLGVILKLPQAGAAEMVAKFREAFGLAENELVKMADLTQRAKFAFGLGPEEIKYAAQYAGATLNNLKLTGIENTKMFLAMPEVGEQVACLIDEHNEEGVVLGGIYSAADPTPVSSQDKRHVAFKDGAQFEYDAASHRATVSLPGGQVRLTIGADGAVEIGGAAVIVVHGDCDIDSRSVLRLRAQTRIETYTPDSRSYPYSPASLPSD